MGWFRRRGVGDSPDSSDPDANPSQDAEGHELFLPGGVADDSVNAEGRGFFVLGGSKQTGRIHYVEVNEEGRAFIELGGRRMLADVPDILPKDEQEINRLDFQHHLLHRTLRGNYAAPITRPGNMLDVGCGTGRWAIEMALQFPNANVIGLDLVAPPAHRGAPTETPPPNYVFVTGNLLDGLPFADASFDFVHMRLLFTAIPANDWLPVVRELVRVTQPGGWVELVEGGLPYNGGPALDKLNRWISEVSARRGIDLRLGAQIGYFSRGARLADVVTHEMAFPVGHNGGRVGQMTAANALGMLESLRALVTTQGVATLQNYNQALADVRYVLSQGQARCALPFYLAYGQRPRR